MEFDWLDRAVLARVAGDDVVEAGVTFEAGVLEEGGVG